MMTAHSEAHRGMTYGSVLALDLRLFDGEGAAAAGNTDGSGTAASPEHTPQGAQAQAGRASRNTGGTQAAGQAAGAPDAGGKTEAGAAAAPKTPEEKRAAFRSLIEGEYREQYAEEARRLIDRRFREGRENAETAEKTRGLLSLLAQRYGVEAGNVDAITKAAEDDDLYWTAEAEKQGMDVGQLKAIRKAERENLRLREQLQQREEQDRQRAADERIRANLRQWDADAKAAGLPEKYPGFDLGQELRDSRFLGMLRAGVPVETAYQAAHMDALLTSARSSAAAEAERKVTENVRARGSRPQEAGTGQTAAFTTKTDVSKLTKEDMEEIKRRVMRGEHISLSGNS